MAGRYGRSGGFAVVVHRDGACSLCCEVAGDEAAQVLRPASDQDISVVQQRCRVIVAGGDQAAGSSERPHNRIVQIRTRKEETIVTPTPRNKNLSAV